MIENELKKIAKLLRYYVLVSTAEAGSGHPTSCLSSVELLIGLFFGGFFQQDIKNPKDIFNDRFILSKGHSAPLLYSIYTVLGKVKKQELMSLRKFGSKLEGHPTPKFEFVDVATGSLGQGLSIGLGMAMGIKLKIKSQKLKVDEEPKIWVLMGDSEMAEGQVWEAVQLASYYNVSNLIALVDINRLGQSRETMLGWQIEDYKRRFEAFNWQTFILKDGHNLNEILKTFEKIKNSQVNKPKVVLAKTIKGKGISFLENKNDWHGRALNKDQLKLALNELGKIDFNIRFQLKKPEKYQINDEKNADEKVFAIINKLENLVDSKDFNTDEKKSMSTREAYGRELVELGKIDKDVVVLDAETGNSTYENLFQQKYPERFFQIFIAEQNMVSIGLGLSKIGFKVYMSTFAAFLTRAFDQIRMAHYSNANLKIAGSHSGVSIGQDGASQMGLEDLAMFNSLAKSVIFYPSDKTSTQKLTQLAKDTDGIIYLRLTRGETPIIYDESEEFEIGGCKVHKLNPPVGGQKQKSKRILLIAAGITVFEALKAQKILKDDYDIVVVDLYCIRPLDEKTLKKLIKNYPNVIVVEDHYQYGGIGSVVEKFILENNLKINTYIHLACKKIPMSGKPEELLEYEEIDYKSIVKNIRLIK
ncbi:MAG: transketolase [Patescibacteria group bacterium]|nr:MAG: transketolase [Patescibacteria group bacterium]